MVIKQRIKDGPKTVGYVVVDSGKKSTLKEEDVRRMAGKVTNAKLQKNGEFRAKEGGYIETIYIYRRFREKSR